MFYLLEVNLSIFVFLDEYHDYYFLGYPADVGAIIFKKGECHDNFNSQVSHPTIYAIKKYNVNDTDIEQWGGIRNFDPEEMKNVIPSNFVFQGRWFDGSLELKITSLTNNKLKVQGIKKYSDGKIEEAKSIIRLPSSLVEFLEKVVGQISYNFEKMGKMYIISLISTILIEFLIIWYFLKKQLLKLLFRSSLINILTVTIAYFVLFFHNYTESFLAFLVIEFIIFLLEIPLLNLFFKISLKKSTIISLVANIISALSGIIIFIYFFSIF